MTYLVPSITASHGAWMYDRPYNATFVVPSSFQLMPFQSQWSIVSMVTWPHLAGDHMQYMSSGATHTMWKFCTAPNTSIAMWDHVRSCKIMFDHVHDAKQGTVINSASTNFAFVWCVQLVILHLVCDTTWSSKVRSCYRGDILHLVCDTTWSSKVRSCYYGDDTPLGMWSCDQ